MQRLPSLRDALFGVLALACVTGGLRAGPIEDARALVQQKKYDDVDKVLERELAAKTPNEQALRISFDAALASGRIVTASNRITTLLKVTQNKEPRLVYLGAEVAAASGDTRMALVRYLAYARLVDQKTPELEEALRYVLKRETYPEEYKKFVRIFGNDALAWQYGTNLLGRLIEVLDADRALEVAEFLMQSFPEPDKVFQVHATLRTAADGFVFGKEPKDRYLRPLRVMAKYVPSDYGHLEYVYGPASAAMTEEQRYQFVADVQAVAKQALPVGLIQGFGNMRALPTDEAKLAAGRAYLALEPLYQAAKTPAQHDYYVRTIGESPQVFNIKDKALVTGPQMVQRFEAIKKLFPGDLIVGQTHHIAYADAYLAADPPARIAFLQQNLPILTAAQLAGLLQLTDNQNASAVINQAVAARPYRDAIDVRGQLLANYAVNKEKDAFLATVREYLAAYPATFNAPHVQGQFIGSPIAEPAEKLAVLQEFITKAGYSPAMKLLLDAMAQDKANWGDKPEFQQVRNAFEQKPQGNDPAMRAIVALANIPVNQAAPDPAVLQTAKDFVAAYGGPVPGGPEKAKTAAEWRAQTVQDQHANHVWNNPDAVVAFAELWAPKTQLGSNWSRMTNRVREHQRPADLAKLIPQYVALCKAANDKGDPAVWGQLAYVSMTKDAAASPLAEAYGLMPTEMANGYVFNQRLVPEIKAQTVLAELAKLAAAPGTQFTDALPARQWLGTFGQWAGPEVKIPPALIKTFWDVYAGDVAKGGLIDPATEALTYGAYLKQGEAEQAAAFLAAWQQMIQTRPPEQQLEGYNALFQWAAPPVEAIAAAPADPANPAAAPPPADPNALPSLQPGFRRHMILKQITPVMSKVPPRYYEMLRLHGQIVAELQPLLAVTDEAAKADPAVAQQRAEAVITGKWAVKLASNGARFEGPGQWLYPVLDLMTRETIAAGNWGPLNHLLRYYGTVLANDAASWDANYAQRVQPLVALLEEQGANESIYAFMASIETGSTTPLPETAAKQVLIAKAKASAQIPGLIPVDATDPTYDLYAAAHAISLGDEGRAWELTGPKLKLLTETWENYDTGYVAWSVDQMRKQKMLKESLDFAFKILLSEKDLAPDVAAAVSLAKGDVYKDLENYQAARIEYEALKNNARYNKTDAGSKGVYRLVDLHIVTKDYVAAEQLLERMVDADNLQAQAEAYYLYAKMAFQQAQYKEAKDYLKRVRDRVLNHVQAALLEGELNLLLPGGLQNTEVAIGDPRLSTTVIPGRQLELKLQDSNLSVARGGAAIPVVITTSKGGDVERAELLPSPTNKNLFAGRISTALGKAEKGNLTLELVGEDVVSYTIDPGFQKANDLSYPAKRLEVRSDARLAASSGEILTEEEEERRELERQMQRRLTLQSRRMELQRDGRTVRPGSKIFVQVADADRDLTDAPDTLRVDMQTASGDLLENFELTETGPHTGLFRGAVPTGIPLPKAAASDAEEGNDPGVVIRDGAAGAWSSLADGKKPKWIEVDTMSSSEVASVAIELENAGQIREVALQGMLADDYEDLALLPERAADAAKGGLTVEVAPDQYGSTAENFRRHIKLASIATYPTKVAGFDRADTAQKAGDGWQTARVRGTFWLPGNASLELKFLQPVSPQNWQIAYVLIDGEPVLGNTINEQTIQQTGKIDLARGAHHLELLVRDHFAQSKVVVGYRKPDGTFEPLPADWFDVAKSPQLKQALEPKGKVTAQGNVLTATLDKPIRLRKLRWFFTDFAGTGVAVKKFTVKDAAGKTIVPGKADFASATKDDTLQIAPGDQITVSYRDARRLRDDGQVLTQQLNSSYYNGTVTLAEEVIRPDPNNPDHKWTTYLEAKRCRPGDQLMIVLTDFDEDTSEERDTVDVTVTTSSGEKLTLKALETWTNYQGEWNNHAGEFLAVLKIGTQTGKDTIKVEPGDRITVSYVDKENTNPGIPIDRRFALFEAGKTAPQLLVYRTKVDMVPDESPEAKAKLKRVAGKENKTAVLYKPLVVARHPDFIAPVAAADGGAKSAGPLPTKGDAVVASVGAPLLFELTYPKMALNAGSVVEVTAVAQSELEAAKKAGRQPTTVKVPTHVEGIERLAQIKGYPIQLQTHVRRDGREMLRDGSFAGVVRLQIGSHGDAVDDLVVNGVQEFATEAEKQSDRQGFFYRVPTLIVSGSDTVHLLVKDKDTGAVAKTKVRLLSDARLEVLDRTYTIESDSIHLGDRFYLRVTDPDHDATDERDTVKLNVASASGDALAMTLTETLPHSGVFTGNLQPQFVGERGPEGKTPTPDKNDDVLSVNFGDEVRLVYTDALSLESSAAVRVAKATKILHGSDAQVATFTKKFKDPEIAVKTRFLMAEALFEMAKEHRKLAQKAQADDEIARGKRILEEAIRDYPDTSLAAQGEYLLANLAQELGNYQEAVGRYSNVISTYPDAEYAAPAQFKKALCFEKLQNFDQAMEEYVKLTYVYPDNSLVADATVRLGNYYYKKQSYKIAGKIFYNFQQRNPTHKLAAEALFLAAQCDYKQADYPDAVKRFRKVIDEYVDEKEVRSEAMYWLADSLFKANDQVKAYQTFKKLTWDYPDSKWAKIARGRLTEEVFSRMSENEE